MCRTETCPAVVPVSSTAAGTTCDATTLSTTVANSTWDCTGTDIANTTVCNGACASGYEANNSLPVATCIAPNFVVTGGCKASGEVLSPIVGKWVLPNT